MKANHHLSCNDPMFMAQLSDDQVIQLCLAGKIYACDGNHDGQEDEDAIYHPSEGYTIDVARIHELVIKEKP